MGTDHEKAIRDYIDNNAGLSVPIYAGSYREGMEDDAIVIRGTTSADPIQKFGGTSSTDIKEVEVRVIARGHSSNREDVKDRVDSIYDTLSGASPPGYMASFPRGSNPVAEGRDGSNRWIMSLIFRLLIEE